MLEVTDRCEEQTACDEEMHHAIFTSVTNVIFP